MHLNFSGTPEKVELDLWELEPKSCFLRVSLTHGVGAKLRNNVTLQLNFSKTTWQRGSAKILTFKEAKFQNLKMHLLQGIKKKKKVESQFGTTQFLQKI